MIRKHTRFIPHSLNQDSHVDRNDWEKACTIGSTLAILAEELSIEGQLPGLPALGFACIFREARVDVPTEVVAKFSQASRMAYRTEQTAYFVRVTSAAVNPSVHIHLKFFGKNERQPFQTFRIVVRDRSVLSFKTD